MSDVRSVVVAGSRFGQFYAAGVAADPRFVLRGILGQGSRRSRALAERLGVETWCEVCVFYTSAAAVDGESVDMG
ncbi:hypothetical protein KZ865_33600, partial [Pseudomonas aeruginosa]|nr:hypothetical protein [Pseudomonas aeruginosa]